MSDGPSFDSLADVADRPGHDRRYAIDATQLEQELAYISPTGLEDGLASTVEWYVANQPWWRSVMDGKYQLWVWVEKNYSTREGST